MKISAVAFDIDGTLYPNHRMFIHTFPSFIRHPLLIWHFSRIRKQIRKKDYHGDFYAMQTEMLAESMKISREKASRILKENLYDEWDNYFSKLKAYPYVKNFILNLRERGIKTAAMSDFPIGRKLEYMDLDNLWDAAFSSEETGYLKPSAVPFLRIAELLKIENNQILYVGNNYKYDIIGAARAGMKTAYLGRKKAEYSADFYFESYIDLENQLFSALGS